MTETSIKPDQREASGTYSRELYHVGGWRVIVCWGGFQWIVQALTREGEPDGGRWEGRHYCLTRAALVRLWRRDTGDDGAWLLANLPERFGGGR